MQYGIDLSLPDLLHAAVKAAPVHGGKLVSVDGAPAMRFAGVERVVKLENSVAVVAGSFWQARRALEALQPVFDHAGNGGVSTATHFAQQDRLLAEGNASSIHKSGDADAVLETASADRIVAASYHVPFLHHAAMEPINATAQFKDGAPHRLGRRAGRAGLESGTVKASGLSADKVTLHALPVGGAFGRRIAATSQYLVQVERDRQGAVAPARENDLDPRGRSCTRAPTGRRSAPAFAPRSVPMAAHGVVAGLCQPDRAGRREGYHLPYDIPAQAISAIETSTHVRTGTWRSVAHSQHAFYTECFIDELAAVAGRDPFAYRRDLLPPGSRPRKVLELVAEKSDWGKPREVGVGAASRWSRASASIVAHVVEASPRADGTPRVHRVTAVVDCGDVCHPDNATAQVEGAIIMGLSAALGEQITIAHGAVVQNNFPDYPILTFADAPPRIDVHFLRSDGPWGGLGEPGLPPVAPALANAMFAVSGERKRALPLVAMPSRMHATRVRGPSIRAVDAGRIRTRPTKC